MECAGHKLSAAKRKPYCGSAGLVRNTAEKEHRLPLMQEANNLKSDKPVTDQCGVCKKKR